MMVTWCAHFKWKWNCKLKEKFCDSFHFLIYYVFDTLFWLHRINSIDFFYVASISFFDETNKNECSSETTQKKRWMATTNAVKRNARKKYIRWSAPNKKKWFQRATQNFSPTNANIFWLTKCRIYYCCFCFSLFKWCV